MAIKRFGVFDSKEKNKRMYEKMLAAQKSMANT
jgi:hypothetical protein